MCNILQKWPRGVIVVFTIVSCGLTLKQEIGSLCSNDHGISGVCQNRENCAINDDLGVKCNSKNNIVCCSKNNNSMKSPLNNTPKKENSIESRLGFNTNFFDGPVVSQKPNITNENFFSPPSQQVLHHDVVQTSNMQHFLAERPYQNLNQDATTKANKKKYTTSTIYSHFVENSNYEEPYLNNRPTKRPQNVNYNYPSYETQRPQQTVNYNQFNNYPSYTSLKPNQNNNYYNYETNTPSQYNFKYPSTVPNLNTNNYPLDESYLSNQNNYHSFSNSPNKRPNNNSFNNNPNYPYQSNNFDSQHFNNYPNKINQSLNNYQNIRPNNNNHQSTSSIYFPNDSNIEQYNTQKPLITNNYNNENYNKPIRPNYETKRISEIKCEEYSKSFVTTTLSVLPLSINTSPKPVSVEKCDSKGVGLIVGGSKADLGEFPHMVAVGFRTITGNPWNCGGTLISEKYVLTAAHCTHSALGNPVRVRLGDLNLHESNDGSQPVDYTVEDIIVHPDYIKTSKYNDIALLRLNKNVQFNKNIRPACLYTKNAIYNLNATATGWGSTDYGSSASDHLLKVNLDIVDNRRCNILYEAESKTNSLSKGIVDSMLCAGDLAGGHDTCLGDSGGPLVIRSEKNPCVFNLIGVTSFGKYCATENSPGVYTRVSSFLSWIEQNVWLK
ncbi:serine protease Hayan-like [Daktulosphaira vitifoliae]|uniref:serine protease Hayan-like n=1 Tax=Daktulosphaira vitifoliae TaxID=58002 RepID=UPI0021AAA910|nr:serine protease Hayan-like [Daktulosphaira vitifoliae]